MKKTFSSQVKDELTLLLIKEKNSAAAEFAAMLLFGENTEHGTIFLKSANAKILARLQVLFKKVTGEAVSIDISGKKQSYSIKITSDIAEKFGVYFSEDGDIELDEDIYADLECKRAFLRGAFLISGTVSSPEKEYSCELFSYNENMAFLAAEIIDTFGIHSNTVKRKEHFVTYLKDKQSVSDFLNIIGAHKSMMDMMMAQIEKDVRNNINRQINCRTANIDNIIKTSVKQCDAIRKLKNSKAWNELDTQTKELAEHRLKNVDANLTQLGKMLTPSISKSTVSRKMNRIIELSEEM